MDQSKKADIIPPPEQVLPRLIYHRRQVQLLEKQLRLSEQQSQFVEIDRTDTAPTTGSEVSHA